MAVVQQDVVAGFDQQFLVVLRGADNAAQLVNELNRHDNVTGLFWWYPEENSYGTPYQGRFGLNRGLFNSADGCALPALYEMSRFKR